ncbi:UDP-N-acetylglucosamine 2-epimerase (hydrolyzing) [Caproiciproducens galactitolivorans]|uniref:GDP/UDP-N,N'-diacetylbacillosamine 2-epimerase (Hydrolyzing) n=1 Tax=Caproiciproducens galactitolivorans TaxID=642589 RepID=A0A4Z0XW05_9FIRM|nr:UDP-N-acetylglucosamine 2-epimerase [Caproiciproducens galactitolivorans]QEY33829.1 UDP-N-acetylglucosamine 2-epimerase (hydrolyzing) [Caproiciproducens galactitolivorans]TGJ75524.1 GDP/UDP-N,N'-diacetylbacillosamine 2-epimerase (hydrolyzing) [Caproiciproducens galactitolivorans]
MKRKICVVTGSRAEYGRLSVLMKEIRKTPGFQLQLIAAGEHLSPEFGLTYREIEDDGFAIDCKVETLLSSDTPAGITKSIGLSVIGFADAFSLLQPELLILTGDRYEILAAAQAALIFKIPVAHIAGGDTTEGAFDEAIRHSITKMSHLHFVTNSEAYQRVKQLGENPCHIYNVGNMGIDCIINTPRMSREELEASLPFSFRKRNLLIAFHPVTMDSEPSSVQFEALLQALNDLGSEVGLLFTEPNADPEGHEIIRLMNQFAAVHPNAAVFPSLGSRCYFSLIEQMDAVVGNSSSGIYEVPFFKKPTVNIGDRQKGRIFSSSIISCSAESTEITKAIHKAFLMDCSHAVNPYGEGNTSAKILSILQTIPDYGVLLKKHFYEN